MQRFENLDCLLVSNDNSFGILFLLVNQQLHFLNTFVAKNSILQL